MNTLSGWAIWCRAAATVFSKEYHDRIGHASTKDSSEPRRVSESSAASGSSGLGENATGKPLEMTDHSELPWTGERLVPSHHGDTAIEHLHRYAFAKEHVGGKTVLDLACGEGYGANLLAGVAAQVIGVDVAADVIDHANRKYGNSSRLSFRVGSCTAVPLDDESVDVVVSFETLEHVDDQEQMLREIRRVLRPRGLLVASTPDKLHYSVLPNNTNPYHVKEFFKEEFEALLGRFFTHVNLFEQKICHGSVIVPAADRAIDSFRHYQGNFQSVTGASGVTSAVYNVALATDEELGAAGQVSLFQGIDVPTEVERDLYDATCRLAEAQGDIRNLDAQLQVSERESIALRQQKADLEEQRSEYEKLRLQLQRVQCDLNEITGSRAWAAIQKLRHAKAFFTSSLYFFTGGHKRA